MPLLHDRIVREMRARQAAGAQKGDGPLSLAVHSASMLVSMVAGEMAAPPMKASVGGQALHASVGGPSITVQYGLPGAWGEVTAYIDKIDAKADLMQSTFAAWAKEKFADDAAKAPTVDEKAYLKDWTPWYARWKSFKVVSEPGIDPTGPSALDTWRKAAVFEEELAELRNRFELLTKSTETKAPKPWGDLEPATPPSIFDKAGEAATSIVKPLLYGGLAVGAGLLFLSVYRRPEQGSSR